MQTSTISPKRSSLVAFCLSLPICFACVVQTASAQESVEVPTPDMPVGWEVTEDFLVTQTELAQFSTAMGTTLVGARNTIFDVDGQTVQVNTVIVANEIDAEQVWTFMTNAKPEQFLLRRGLTVYEFVGTDAVLLLIEQGRQYLEQLP